MMVDGRQLRAAWREAVPKAGAQYTLSSAQEPWFVGCSKDGWPTLLRRLAEAPQEGSRSLGAVRLSLLRDANIQLPEGRELAHIAALECRDVAVLETFVVLALDLMRTVGNGPATGRELHTRLGQWRDLLTPQAALSLPEQQGLWGELEVLSRFPNLGSAIEGWSGPDRESIDFSRNAIGIEVKTSTNRRMHQLRWNQAVFAATSLDCYLASLHVVVDPVGTTLPKLVNQLLQRAPDPYALRLRLLAANYHDNHANEYARGWTLAEEPSFFLMSSIPRFTELPDGVHDVRWRVDLTNKRALPSASVQRLLAQFVETK